MRDPGGHISSFERHLRNEPAQAVALKSSIWKLKNDPSGHWILRNVSESCQPSMARSMKFVSPGMFRVPVNVSDAGVLTVYTSPWGMSTNAAFPGSLGLP